MAHHIIKISEQSPTQVKPVSTINALPPGRIREAASMLELAYKCTSNCPELTGLYYDQLTSMFLADNNIDKYFISWLYESIHDEFEKTYVVTHVPNRINDIEFTMHYGINR